MKPEKAVERWNRKYPIGTNVRFYSVKGGRTFKDTKTTTAAYVLSGHTAVVFVEGVTGCVALDNTKPLGEGKL